MRTQNTTPDPLAPWEKKLEKEYGLSLSDIIFKDWFEGGQITNGCSYAVRRDWIQEKRKVARGEQSVEDYKRIISRQDGDLKYLNLDFSIINFEEKFSNLVANGISDDYYDFDIIAMDPFTSKKRQKLLERHRRNMHALPLMQQAKDILGLDMMPPGFVPQDEEALILHNEVKERPKIEQAEQITIKYIKSICDYEEIERQKNKDLTEIGICAARVWTDPINGVQVEYVDPEFLMHSYARDNSFKKVYYYAVLDKITIHDLQRESDLKDNEIRKIAKQFAGGNTALRNFDQCPMDDLMGIEVEVLRFAFKTTKGFTYKTYKKNGVVVKVSEREDDFDPKERSDYGALRGAKSTWVEGTRVVGSDYLYNYKECENIIRDEQDNALPPFVVRSTNIWKNKLRSFLSNIEVPARQMQLIHLKIQHLIAEIKPDINEIDLDALADLTEDGKDGDKQKTWEMALNILNVKGVIFTQRIDMGEMGIKEGAAARPRPVQQGTGLVPLLNTWAHYYNVIRDTTGINPARDGSLPHDALLGINQMAELASNTVTKHIVDAAVDFNKRVAKTISARVHRIFSNKDAAHLQKIYSRAVGKHNVEAMEAMKDRNLHDFGFITKMLPTMKELEAFKETLQLAMADGGIDVDIKVEAENIAKIDIELAQRYLAYKRKERRKELLEEKKQEFQSKSQADIAANQNASQMRMLEEKNRAMIDVEAFAKKEQIKVLTEQALQQVRAPEKEQEFKREVYLEQVKAIVLSQLKERDNDRKDMRTEKQATQQSLLKDQAKRENSKPINFEKDAFNNIFKQNRIK